MDARHGRFDGDPARETALQAALVAVRDAFPRHLARPQPPAPFEADARIQNERFDAILAAHKKDRLTIPIEALRAVGAPHHGFERSEPRRLAWFVPSILASWIHGAPSRTDDAFGATEIEAIMNDVAHDRWGWTIDEDAALDAFFVAALDAAIATPLRTPKPASGRPLEDGVDVWSLHSPSVPLDVLRVARAMHVSVEALAAHWAAETTPLALAHLLEAVFDTEVSSKRLLAWDAVAERLADGFFSTTGADQARFAKAEKTVRRNVARIAAEG